MVARYYTNTSITAAATDADGAAIDFKNGEYVIHFSVGTPPVQTFAVFDTGSHWLWLQSTLCLSHCYHQSPPLFDPSRSSTFRSIRCDNPNCKRMPSSSCNIVNCLYRVSYADSTSSSGRVATETFTFGQNAGRVEGIFFGAAIADSLPSWWRGDGPPGIAGFAAGGFSVVAQLRVRSFSHCFPQDSKLMSYVRFNEMARLEGSSTVTLPNSIGVYFVALMDFSLGNPPQHTKINIPQPGHLLVDTGTAYTQLTPSMIGQLVNAMKAKIGSSGHNPVGGLDPHWSLCYKHAAMDTLRETPITLQLGSEYFVLSFENSWISITMKYFFGMIKKRYFCLAFLKRRNEIHSILGAYQMRNVNIGYDVVTEKVYFSPRDCSK